MVEHASEPENTINLDTYNANKSAPLTPEQRLKKQIRFLKAFSETANIKHSCKYAGINRSTFYHWRDNDEIFAAHLTNCANEDANDTLEYAGYDRAVNGVPSYVVSQGKIVYEEVPDLDKDGCPKLDKDGNALMKRGKPLIERKYSDSLLVTLLKARMPQKYKDRQEVNANVTGQSSALITIDTRSLSSEQLAKLKAFALEIKESETNG